MKYTFYEIGKKPRIIETKKIMDEKEVQKLLQGEQISFVLLKNQHVLCVNAEANIMNLPYNPAFKLEDFQIEMEDQLRGNILEGKIGTDSEFVGL